MVRKIQCFLLTLVLIIGSFSISANQCNASKPKSMVYSFNHVNKINWKGRKFVVYGILSHFRNGNEYRETGKFVFKVKKNVVMYSQDGLGRFLYTRKNSKIRRILFKNRRNGKISDEGRLLVSIRTKGKTIQTFEMCSQRNCCRYVLKKIYGNFQNRGYILYEKIICNGSYLYYIDLWSANTKLFKSMCKIKVYKKFDSENSKKLGKQYLMVLILRMKQS